MQISKLHVHVRKGNKGVCTAILVVACVFIYWNNERLRSISSNSDMPIYFRVLEQETLDMQCSTGRPCVYEDVVVFRIIVITYNRAQSFMKLLKTIDEV